MGCALFVLMWLQPVNGVLRPLAPRPGAPATRYRQAWEKAHKWFGYFLLGYGVVNVLTGESNRRPAPPLPRNRSFRQRLHSPPTCLGAMRFRTNCTRR